MKVLDQVTAPAAPTTGLRARVGKIRGALAGALITVAFVVGNVGTANAAPPDTDLTNGAGDTFFETITAYFTGNVLVSVLTLLALMVGVGVLISWGRKAAKAK